MIDLIHRQLPCSYNQAKSLSTDVLEFRRLS